MLYTICFTKGIININNINMFIISFILTKKKSIEISSQQKYISYLHYCILKYKCRKRLKQNLCIFNRKQLAYMSLCHSYSTKSIHISKMLSPRSLVLHDEKLYKT